MVRFNISHEIGHAQRWKVFCLALCYGVQTSVDGQNGMTRAIVGVELLCFEKIIEFKDNSLPTLAQVGCASHRL